MTTKRTNITSSIKRQLNGAKPKTVRLDTQSAEILEHLEADTVYNADKYATVNILGVDVLVPVEAYDER